MQSLFLVLAKLLGILLTYWGLMALVAAVLVGDARDLSTFNFVTAGLAFGFAFTLTFRTEWLARRLGLGAELAIGRNDDPSRTAGGFDAHAALRVGIVLIGIYVFLVRLAIVLNLVFIQVRHLPVTGVGDPVVRVMIEAVPLVLAVVLIFGADRLASYLLRRSKR